MNKLFIITILFSLTAISGIYAQPVKISGKVTDQKGVGIEYATISLIQFDSTFVKGDISNAKGDFSLNMLRPGNYFLSVSFVGYKTTVLEIMQPNKNMDVGNIQLTELAVELYEVTVSANTTIHKSGYRIVIPGNAQAGASTDAIDLLQKMQLPRLLVDPLSYKVSVSGGGEVQLRLNGRQVEAAELSTTAPDEIIRIEYHEDTGAKYGNAAAVINFVTLQRKTGVNINANLINSPQIGYSEDNVSIRFNHKKSEFMANAYLSSRKLNWIRENHETFVFPDSVLYRREEGQPTVFKTRKLNFTLNYSLRDKDKYHFNIALRNNHNNTPNNYNDRISYIHTLSDPVPLSVHDHTESKENMPVMDVYFQRRLKNNQTVVFNVVGTYINSKITRQYQESKENYLLTDIISETNGKKYSLIMEGIYENRFKSGILTSGVKHTESRLHNRYTGNVDSKVLLNQSETQLYSEYQLGMDKWTTAFGIGLSRISIRQENSNQERYTAGPSLRVTYNFNEYGFIRYQGHMTDNLPALSYLNDVEQFIDSLQIRRGNPRLKPFNSFSNSLSGGYNSGKISIEGLFRYTYMHRPVMEQTLFENGKFIRTQENQPGFHRLFTELSVKLKPWKDYLHISITPGFNRFISHGHEYSHTYNNLYFHASLLGVYKGLMLYSEIRTHNDLFMGETLTYGENTHMILVGFHFGIISASIGYLCPFESVYKTAHENWSSLAPYTSDAFTKNLVRTLIIRFSCNLNFGREYKSDKKRMDNSDTDSGIITGRKQ